MSKKYECAKCNKRVKKENVGIDYDSAIPYHKGCGGEINEVN